MKAYAKSIKSFTKLKNEKCFKPKESHRNPQEQLLLKNKIEILTIRHVKDKELEKKLIEQFNEICLHSNAS